MREGSMAGLCGLSGLVGILLFNFVAVCTLCVFLERVPRFKPAFVFVYSFRRSEGGRMGVAMAGRSGFPFSSVRVDFFKPQTHQHHVGRES